MAWTIIDSLNAPASNVFDFPSLTLTSYKVIRIEMSGITVTTDGTDLKLTFYVSGSEVTSGYRWATLSEVTTGSFLSDGATSAAAILLVSDNSGFDTGNASVESYGGEVTVDAPASTALYKKANFVSWAINPTSSLIRTKGMGLMENTGAITGLKIAGTSNLTAGKVRLLGLA